MEAQLQGSFDPRTGMTGGLLLVLLVQLLSEELVKTVVLAVVGAVASFGVSVGLKWLWSLCSKSKKEE